MAAILQGIGAVTAFSSSTSLDSKRFSERKGRIFFVRSDARATTTSGGSYLKARGAGKLIPNAVAAKADASTASTASKPPGSRFCLHESKNQRNFITHCSANGDNKEPEKEIPIEKRYPAYPTVMDINQIREILPHRFPFLLVDRVIEYNPGVSAVAIKNVTINDNFFPGHFPERPIMPGVLMVEALAQVGGLVMLQPEVGGSRENFFFAGIDKVRFRKPVIAGDTLVMKMTLIKLQKRFGIAKMEGKAYVGGEVVCEGEFLMATGTSSE